jgi:hypothetical protein
MEYKASSPRTGERRFGEERYYHSVHKIKKDLFILI